MGRSSNNPLRPAGKRDRKCARWPIESQWLEVSGLGIHACVAGEEPPVVLIRGTASRATTCSRSPSRSPSPSPCSHRTCPATGVVSGRAPRWALPILPPRSPGGWTRPDSGARRFWRTRWAVRSSPNSPCACRGAWGRWCSSVRRSIRSAAPRATSSSAGCVMQGGNRGRCLRSPTASSSACR